MFESVPISTTPKIWFLANFSKWCSNLSIQIGNREELERVGGTVDMQEELSRSTRAKWRELVIELRSNCGRKGIREEGYGGMALLNISFVCSRSCSKAYSFSD